MSTTLNQYSSLAIPTSFEFSTYRLSNIIHHFPENLLQERLKLLHLIFNKNACKFKEKRFIIIGSSMGSWIALNLFKIFSKQIIGFIGIGSAPEFLEKLMWNKFTKEIKKTINTKKIYHIKHGDYTYPLTKQLFLDGKKNKVLKMKLKIKIPVAMFHGSKDDVVPTNFSKKILKIFPKAKKKIFIIKGGDHSLSKKKYLNKICKELGNIIKNAS